MKPNKIAKMLLTYMIIFALAGTTIITAKADGAEVITEEETDTQTTEDTTGETTEEGSEEENNETSDKEDKDKKKKKKKNKKSGKKTAKDVKAAPEADYTKEELKLMSCIIWCEARGESNAGKLAVGIVVMNRKESSSFPNTIRGVIYQKGQFSPVTNGSFSKALKLYKEGKFEKSKEGKACINAAKAALSGEKKVTSKGKTKNLSGYYFFSQYLSGCRYKLGNHMFK